MPDFPVSLPRPNPFTCGTERHLWRHGLALAIYQKVGQITAGGQRKYFTDTARMALFFEANKTYVRRAFALLHNVGLLIVTNQDVKRARGVKVRQWISHEDWAKANPGKCVSVDVALMPWAGDADPLCGRLWAALDGKMRMYENLLKHARSCGLPDDEIIAAISANWKLAKEKRANGNYDRTGTKAVFFDTISTLKGLPKIKSGHDFEAKVDAILDSSEVEYVRRQDEIGKLFDKK